MYVCEYVSTCVGMCTCACMHMCVHVHLVPVIRGTGKEVVTLLTHHELFRVWLWDVCGFPLRDHGIPS